MPHQARACYQTNLDAVSRALWTRDVDLMLRHISLPSEMMTADTRVVVASAEEMSILANEFRDVLEAMGADDYVRTCRSARFVPGQPDIIEGDHDTAILRRGTLLRPVIRNRMTLVRTGRGEWQALRIMAESRNSETPIISPDLAEGQRAALQRLLDGFVRRPQTEG